jgi:hypothetical protein
MKKSELRQMIMEELLKINEVSRDKPEYVKHINVGPNKLNVILYNDRIKVTRLVSGDDFIMIDELPALMKVLQKIK